MGNINTAIVDEGKLPEAPKTNPMDFDFMQMMDILQVLRETIQRERERISKEREFTDDDQLEIILKTLDVPTSAAFLGENENGDKLDKRELSQSIHEFIKYRESFDAEKDLRPPYHIGEYQKFLKNQTLESKKMHDEKKATSADVITKKIETAETEFRKSPEFYETVFAILENTLEETKNTQPNPSMYYWATQQLVDSEELTVELVETETEQQIKFAVTFPGVSKEFKTVCFKKQKEIIAAKTSVRDLSDLDKTVAAAKGDPIPKTTDEASLNKYDDFTKNPSSQFLDYKKKMFPDRDVNTPIIGAQPITENRRTVAAIVNTLRNTPSLEETKELGIESSQTPRQRE